MAVFIIVVGISVICFREESISSKTDIQYAIDKLGIKLGSQITQYPIIGLHRVLKRLLHRMLAEKQSGRVLRIAAKHPLTPLDPFTVPFEPRAFKEISDELRSASENISDTQSLAIKKGTPKGRFEILRNICMQAIAYLPLLCILWIIVGAVIEIINTGEIPSYLYVFSMCALVVCAFEIYQQGCQQVELLVIPGTLIRRSCGWFSRKWRLHMFVPAQTVVLAHKHPTGVWLVQLSDGREWADVNLSDEQAEFFLRAWLSPLEPPQIEQLSDLR